MGACWWSASNWRNEDYSWVTPRWGSYLRRMRLIKVSGPRSWSLKQKRGGHQLCRWSWFPRAGMLGAHADACPPASSSSLHFASSIDVETSSSFQKEDKHGFQCRLKYTRTFETWLVITNSWLLSSKQRKTFPLVGLATKSKKKKINDLYCTLKQLKTQTFPEYNISSSLVTRGAIF